MERDWFSSSLLYYNLLWYPILIFNLYGQAYGGSGNQQSRLNQWKLPSLDKDGEGSEFSRAPGTAKSTTSPQLNQLGLQPDS